MKSNYPSMFSKCAVLCLFLSIFNSSNGVSFVSGEDCFKAIHSASMHCEETAKYNQTVLEGTTQVNQEVCCIAVKYLDCIKADFPKDDSCKLLVDPIKNATEERITATCGSQNLHCNGASSAAFLSTLVFVVSVLIAAHL